MDIPESFKATIRATFYNSELKVRSVTTQTDAEGGEQKVAGPVEETTTGNIAPVSAELSQTMLGQDIIAELKITAPDNIQADKGKLIEAKGEIYEIVDFKRYESHAEMLVKRWRKP